MNKLKLLAIFLPIIVLSCSKKPHEVISTDNVENKNISLTKLILEDEPLFPKGCAFIDSTLVIFDPKDKEGILSFYHNDKRIGKFGTIGQGPYDFKVPRFISNGRELYDKTKIQIGDTDKLYYVNLDSVISGNAMGAMVSSDLPKDLRLYNYLLYNDDSRIVVSQTGEHQLTFYDKESNEATRKNYFEKISQLGDAPDLFYNMEIYDAYYTSNDKTIVIAYKNRKIIDLVSTNGTFEKRIKLPGYDVNDGKMRFVENRMEIEQDALRFFSYVYSTKKYFYALCWNDTKANMRSGKVKSLVYQFNWDGELEKIYTFDKSISYFCLNGSSIYAVAVSEDNLEPSLYYGQL